MKNFQKKSLGQNFLRDKAILKKIADFAQIGKEDTLVEVGPGEGTLTELLLERAEEVVAVEKDGRMVEFLKEKFANEIKSEKLKVIEGDIIDLKLTDLKYFAKDYILVGNIPYYITGALFKKFLEFPNPPKSITFVIQKEVAERIIGSRSAKDSLDKKESILSISIKAYGTPEYGGTIKAGSFNPKPKVDSAIIAIRNISKIKFEESEIEEKEFFEVLKAGFAHKRKLLASNLEKFENKEKIKKIFKKCGISEKARAENLKVEDWICLAKEFSPESFKP